MSEINENKASKCRLGRPGSTSMHRTDPVDGVRRMLAVARVLNGWGQQYAAEKIGMSQALYSGIEAGRCSLKPRWVVPVATAFGFDPLVLWRAVVDVEFFRHVAPQLKQAEGGEP